MRPLLTAAEYRRVDEAYPGDMSVAMDRAGHAVALAAVRQGAGYGKRVVVLAGPGNNGGDGYVAARYLRSRGAHVEVHALASPATELAKAAATAARDCGVVVRDLEEPVSADLIIDAVFGGGGRPGASASLLAWMDTPDPVVAVDYPTGLDPDTGEVTEKAFHAIETVTFGTMKTGHVRGRGPDHCGTVTVADIGINGGAPSMYIAEESDALRPPRRRTVHKWSAGAVLVVGGSTGLVGASILAGRSALGFGAGTVYLASKDLDRVQRSAPDLPAYDLERALDQLDRFDVVVAGPGLASDDAESVRPLLAKARRVVLDAGGLTPQLLEASKDGGGEVVLTPHDGEFAGVAGTSPGVYSIRSFATREGVVVLRKGNPTMISDGGLPILVTSGGPELASIGTGDVLAGMIGALWARGLSPVQSAISGAYWHGVAAADLARTGTVTALRLAGHVGRFAW